MGCWQGWVAGAAVGGEIGGLARNKSFSQKTLEVSRGAFRGVLERDAAGLDAGVWRGGGRERLDGGRGHGAGRGCGLGGGVQRHGGGNWLGRGAGFGGTRTRRSRVPFTGTRDRRVRALARLGGGSARRGGRGQGPAGRGEWGEGGGVLLVVREGLRCVGRGARRERETARPDGGRVGRDGGAAGQDQAQAKRDGKGGQPGPGGEGEARERRVTDGRGGHWRLRVGVAGFTWIVYILWVQGSSGWWSVPSGEGGGVVCGWRLFAGEEAVGKGVVGGWWPGCLLFRCGGRGSVGWRS